MFHNCETKRKGKSTIDLNEGIFFLRVEDNEMGNEIYQNGCNF